MSNAESINYNEKELLSNISFMRNLYGAMAWACAGAIVFFTGLGIYRIGYMQGENARKSIQVDSLPSIAKQYDFNKDGTLQKSELETMFQDYDFQRKTPLKQR